MPDNANSDHPDGSAPRLTLLEPILAVSNVVESTRYYRDVLEFDHVWTWGDPPTFGGARRDGVGLMFTQNAEHAATADGREIWLRFRNVAEQYARHRELGATVLEELQPRPWGVDEYVLRDPDGYRLRIA